MKGEREREGKKERNRDERDPEGRRGREKETMVDRNVALTGQQRLGNIFDISTIGARGFQRPTTTPVGKWQERSGNRTGK